MTSDTQEDCLKDAKLCVKKSKFHTARSQVTDFVISTQKDFHMQNNYTYIGVVNNLHLSFKVQHISQIQNSQKTKNSTSTAPAAAPRRAAPKPKSVNPLDGVTFQLSSNVVTDGNIQFSDVSVGMPIKKYDDILAEYFYDFATEEQAIV